MNPKPSHTLLARESERGKAKAGHNCGILVFDRNQFDSTKLLEREFTPLKSSLVTILQQFTITSQEYCLHIRFSITLLFSIDNLTTNSPSLIETRVTPLICYVFNR